MKRHTNNPSGTRVAVAVLLAAALVICLFNFTDAGSGIARARVAFGAYADDGRFYPIRKKKSVYDSTGGTGFTGAPIPVEIVSLQLVSSGNPADSIELPMPGRVAQFDSFFDVFTELSIGGGTFNVDSFFDITYKIEGTSTDGNDGTWDTEILSMDLKGSVPGPSGPLPIAIRESPTLASTGQHILRTLSDGTFEVDSFFDVFTELSLDGGGTYHPASSSLRLDLTRLVPEPASAVLAMLGLAGLGVLARRRRR